MRPRSPFTQDLRPPDASGMEIGAPETEREIEVAPLEEPVPSPAPAPVEVPTEEPVPA